MLLKIVEVNLFYGRQRIPLDIVSKSYKFLDLETDAPAEAVIRAMAILSEQSGDHPIGGNKPSSVDNTTDIRLHMDVSKRYANLTGSGISVRWETDRIKSPSLTDFGGSMPDWAEAMRNHLVNYIHLPMPFVVTTAQRYGRNWQNAEVVDYFDRTKRLSYKGEPLC